MVLSNCLDRGHKRSVLSLSCDPDFMLAKRQRLENPSNDLTHCYPTIPHDAQLNLSPVSTDSFAFGDMVNDFDSDPYIADSDHFFVDLPIVADSSAQVTASCKPQLHMPKVELATSQAVNTRPDVTSPVSSSSPVEQASHIPDLTTVPAISTSKSLQITTSPVSSVPSHPGDSSLQKKDESSPGDAVEMDQFHEKRMADRAARNRESSRRAREKAKQRLRALENQNRSLLDMVQYLRTQNEALFAQLHRSRTVQQNCSLCAYNGAGTSPPPPAPQAIPQPVHGAARLDHCEVEKRVVDASYSGSI